MLRVDRENLRTWSAPAHPSTHIWCHGAGGSWHHPQGGGCRQGGTPLGRAAGRSSLLTAARRGGVDAGDRSAREAESGPNHAMVDEGASFEGARTGVSPRAWGVPFDFFHAWVPYGP